MTIKNSRFASDNGVRLNSTSLDAVVEHCDFREVAGSGIDQDQVPTALVDHGNLT